VCYSLRELNRQRMGAEEPLPPSTSGQPFSRPRLAGAIAAAVLAAAGVAALLWPAGTPAKPDVSGTQAAAPGAGMVVEQTAAGINDGVPSNTEVARTGRAAGVGHCEHDL
jgi:hypothetical protein